MLMYDIPVSMHQIIKLARSLNDTSSSTKTIPICIGTLFNCCESALAGYFAKFNCKGFFNVSVKFHIPSLSEYKKWRSFSNSDKISIFIPSIQRILKRWCKSTGFLTCFGTNRHQLAIAPHWLLLNCVIFTFLKRKSLKFIAEDLSNKNIVAYKNIEARIPLVGFYVL